MEHYESLLRNRSLTNINDSKDDPDYDFCFDGYQNTSVCIEHRPSVILIICCIGLLLNGIVIWLLSFQVKRSASTVLILNLAVADFGFLLCMALFCIHCFTYFMPPGIPQTIFFSAFSTMHVNGLFLLTAVGIDRCASVLFSECHRYSWPRYLSSTRCVYLWIFSFLLGGSLYIKQYSLRYSLIWNFYLVVIAVLCLPLTTISTLFLLIKIRFKSTQMKRGRLSVMILITLLCFLSLTLPLYIYMFIVHFLGMNYILRDSPFDFYFYLSASLNSSLKPVIYFVVVRKKHVQTRESIKVIFQNVSREDEAPETGEELTKTVSNLLQK